MLENPQIFISKEYFNPTCSIAMPLCSLPPFKEEKKLKLAEQKCFIAPGFQTASYRFLVYPAFYHTCCQVFHAKQFRTCPPPPPASQFCTSNTKL